MRLPDPIETAMRAANAVAGKGGWLAAIDAEGRQAQAVEHVRRFPEAPAEALFLEIGRKGPTWAELNAVKRVAVEVFRATLLVCDQLVVAETPPPAPAERDLSGLEPAIEPGDRFGDRELWG